MIVSLPLMSLVLVLGLTGLGWWLAQVNSLARKFGSTMVILILGLLLANVTSWTPEPSAVSWVNGPLTSFAIAELLLAVELRSVLPDARRWFRWPLAECLVASQAAVGGPSTALALAGSLERPNLVLSSVAIGLLGYLLGTFVGLAVSAIAEWADCLRQDRFSPHGLRVHRLIEH